MLTFQTATRRSFVMYATRGPSIASVQIGFAVGFTLLACGWAAPACAAKTSRANARNSPARRSLVMA